LPDALEQRPLQTECPVTHGFHLTPVPGTPVRVHVSDQAECPRKTWRKFENDEIYAVGLNACQYPPGVIVEQLENVRVRSAKPDKKYTSGHSGVA